MADKPKAAAKITADEQVKFLIACIKHSTNGRPNFHLVAKEVTTTEKELTKGAAAKRYERLLKAHDIPSLSTQAKAAAAKSPDKKKDASASAAADGEAEEDNDEGLVAPPAKKRKFTMSLEMEPFIPAPRFPESWGGGASAYQEEDMDEESLRYFGCG